MLSNAMPVRTRVTNLETAMVQLIAQVDRTSRGLAEFKEEMREFKDEMIEFKNEMTEFKDEMRDFKNESERFRQESRNTRG